MRHLKMLFYLSLKSLWNRRSTALLTILSVALSVCLLLSIERIRNSARSSFESTVSGVDLIVGARGGTLNLLLYSVFNIGNATNNISYQTYQQLLRNDNVDWAIPIALGDSHEGFRVVGTSQDYLKHYQFAGNKKLSLVSGEWFTDLYDVVIGSYIAEQLKYRVGDSVTLAHGADGAGFQKHDDQPFVVKGILNATGTPVDKSLYISLAAMTAIHMDWQGEVQEAKLLKGDDINDVKASDLTSVFIKLNSKLEIFNFQRWINNYNPEPLTAILPGVSLSELWQTLGTAENILIVVSFMVFIVSLLAMLIALLSTLNERRREMAILRAVGAGRPFIFSILVVEGFLLAFAGIILGVLILYIGLFLFKQPLESKMGLSLNLLRPSTNEYIYLIAIMICAVGISVIPAFRAYSKALSDGLTVKT